MTHCRCLLVLIVGLVAVWGCAPRKSARGPSAGLELPAWSDLATAYNGRVRKLSHLAARGTVSLKWQDEEGNVRREPQVELALWIRQPRSTAMSMEKLGTRYFWLGSNEEEFWLFDLSRRPTRLVVGRHDDFDASASPISLHPLTLLEALGLRELPEEACPMRVSADGKTIVVRSTGRSGPVDLYLQPHSWLPVRVDLLDENEQVAVWCEMRDYKTANLPGAMVLEHPFVPGVFDLRDTAGRLEIRVQLENGTCAVEGQPYSRVFDLAQLISHLEPDETNRIGHTSN